MLKSSQKLLLQSVVCCFLILFRSLSFAQFSYTPSSNFFEWNPTKAITADMDGDGKPDLITQNTQYPHNDSVTVFLNNGTPSAISYTANKRMVLASVSTSIALADINGDGKPDLVVLYPYLNTVAVYLNTSTIGSVSFDIGHPVTTGTATEDLATGDIDGDGKPDLVIVGNNALSLIRNKSTAGSVSFDSKIDFSISSYLSSVAISDLDGDGKPDISVLTHYGDSISVFRNTSSPGTISLTTGPAFVQKGILRKILANDLDGDGKPELEVINDSTRAVFIYANTSSPGSISFVPQPSLNISSIPVDIVINDFDGDGKADIAITGDSVSFIKNLSTGNNFSFGTEVGLLANPEALFLGTGDVNNDGKPDLISIDFYENSIAFLINTGTAGPPPHITSITPDSGATGKTVTLHGNNMSGTSSVSFGGTPAASFIVFPDSVQAVIGAGASGNVVVTTFSGSDSLAGFVFISGPVIKSFSPDTALSGTAVTIKGTDLSGTTAVYFGGTAAASFTIISDSSLTAIVGSGTSGFVSVNTAVGVDSVPGFIYKTNVPAPHINTFTPSSGSEGSTITITGDHFTGTIAVSFGGASAGTFTIISDSMIQATVGTGSSGAVSINTPQGADSLNGFTYINPSLPPKIFSYSPSSGTSGTLITITGTHFINTNTVGFGYTAAASFTVLSDSIIKATVGTGATGYVFVATPTGIDSVGGFIFTPPLSLYPNPASTYVVVSIPASASATGLKIVDMNGKTVKTIFIPPNTTAITLNLSGIPPGMYIIYWGNSSGSGKQILIIQ